MQAIYQRLINYDSKWFSGLGWNFRNLCVLGEENCGLGSRASVLGEAKCGLIPISSVLGEANCGLGSRASVLGEANCGLAPGSDARGGGFRVLRVILCGANTEAAIRTSLVPH